MRIRNGIIINCLRSWITSYKLEKKINKAAKLKQAQLLATKNGEVTPYRRSVFKERIKEAQKDLEKLD